MNKIVCSTLLSLCLGMQAQDIFIVPLAENPDNKEWSLLLVEKPNATEFVAMEGQTKEGEHILTSIERIMREQTHGVYTKSDILANPNNPKTIIQNPYKIENLYFFPVKFIKGQTLFEKAQETHAKKNEDFWWINVDQIGKRVSPRHPQSRDFINHDLYKALEFAPVIADGFKGELATVSAGAAGTAEGEQKKTAEGEQKKSAEGEQKKSSELQLSQPEPIQACMVMNEAMTDSDWAQLLHMWEDIKVYNRDPKSNLTFVQRIYAKAFNHILAQLIVQNNMEELIKLSGILALNNGEYTFKVIRTGIPGREAPYQQDATLILKGNKNYLSPACRQQLSEKINDIFMRQSAPYAPQEEPVAPELPNLNEQTQALIQKFASDRNMLNNLKGAILNNGELVDSDDKILIDFSKGTLTEDQKANLKKAINEKLY